MLCENCAIAAPCHLRLPHFCFQPRFDMFMFVAFGTRADRPSAFLSKYHNDPRITWMQCSHQCDCDIIPNQSSSCDRENDSSSIQELVGRWTQFWERPVIDSMRISTESFAECRKMEDRLSQMDGWSKFEWFWSTDDLWFRIMFSVWMGHQPDRTVIDITLPQSNQFKRKVRVSEWVSVACNDLNFSLSVRHSSQWSNELKISADVKTMWGAVKTVTFMKARVQISAQKEMSFDHCQNSVWVWLAFSAL